MPPIPPQKLRVLMLQEHLQVAAHESRRPLEPGMKLAITLRFLVTGTATGPLPTTSGWHTTAYPRSCQRCTAIYKEYKEKMFNIPSTQDEWKAVARQFGTRWNFHHCCGAIDGKHIAIKKPNKSGSLYYNYKRFCSVVLLAIS
ncbi:uncharacterized protein LOC115922825 [Strongylocentrotus purpuratus]|uniref:DDE Tnp4 domain-containing protein n=1 Tax=Strongylocentrotus purpuratus TaxID=7668 RepID=A0A7M7NNT5_STRPU|nr:uncharacterized protein LOC115922825 [Strongylocentrotus purpuratus]